MPKSEEKGVIPTTSVKVDALVRAEQTKRLGVRSARVALLGSLSGDRMCNVGQYMKAYVKHTDRLLVNEVGQPAFIGSGRE